MLRKIIIFSSVFLVFGFGANALSLPQLYILNPKLEKSSFNAGEEIKGEITVFNTEKNVVPGLKIFVKLLTEKSSNAKLLAWQEGETFFLLAGEKANKNFAFKLLGNLPKGKLFLKIQILSASGEELAWDYQEISILNSGEPLIKMSGVKLISKAQEAKPMIAVDSSDLKVNFNNSSSAYPEITIWKKNIGGEIIKVVKGEESAKSIDISNVSVPGINIGLLVLKDSNSNAISGPVILEWLSKGVGGEIITAVCDKDLYLKGETAKISIAYNVYSVGEGSDSALLKVKINSNEAQKEISGTGTAIIEVPIAESINKFSVNSIIEKDGKNLASYSFDIASSKLLPLENISENKKSNMASYYIVLSVFIIIILLLIALFYRRKSLMLLFILLLPFLYFNFADATEIIGSCNNDLSFYWAKPAQGPMSLTDPLVFEGTVILGGDPSHAFHPSTGIAIRYFIGQDTGSDPSYEDCCNNTSPFNINNCAMPSNSCPYNASDFFGDPITTNNKCVKNCLFNLRSVGADVSGYLYSKFGGASGEKVSNLPFCGEAKILQPSALYYLGTIVLYTNEDKAEFIYPDGSSTATIAGIIWRTARDIEFSITPANMPTLPSDLGFSGPAKFYADIRSVYNNPTKENDMVEYCKTPEGLIKCKLIPYTGEGCFFGVDGSTDDLNCGAWVWNISTGGNVNIINPPYVENLKNGVQNYCGTKGQGTVGISWVYRSNSSNNLKKYRIKYVDSEGSQSTYTSSELSIAPNSTVTPNFVVVFPNPDFNNLQVGFGVTYNWCVEVMDSNDNWSAACDPSSGPSFTTQSKPSPSIDFSFDPKIPGAGEIVKFTNESDCFSAFELAWKKCKEIEDGTTSGETGISYNWNFFDGETSNAAEPEHIFMEGAEGTQIYIVSLDINDSGLSCNKSKTIGVVPPPKWIETAPK